ncbi:MAG: BCCT family transporter [Micrococcaceae bacterium]
MSSHPEEPLNHWSPSEAWRGLSKPVFIPAVLIILAALVWATWYGATYQEDAAEAFSTLRDAIGSSVGWWYVLIATGFVVFALWAGMSKAGQIKLGRDDEQPEFSRLTWFAMLFSAGMGIGLVFWGVAEPLNHMMNPPDFAQVEGGTIEAAGTAIGQTFYHWGLHAWAIYVVVGLGLAYMTFRRGRPLALRWLLEPIFGRKLIESGVGHVIDVVAIVGTLFGVATSLGQGVLQIEAGLEYLDWVESSPGFLIALVGGITALATLSVISGLYAGLKWLSNINMMMAAVLALFVLLAGPTLFLLQSLVQNSGEYAMAFPQLMLASGAGAEDGWTVGWTIYYWGWWMSWAPFVGMFIARISRGRTIREFVAGVLLAPTIIGIIWFTIFGSSGIYRQLTAGDMVGEDGVVDTNTSLFHLLEGLPWSTITSVLAIVVIVLFFVTSSDSGSLVVDILSYGGRTETHRITRLFWSLMEGTVAAVLLVVGGTAALTVLQVSSIAAALPLSVVMVLAVVAMIRMFRFEAATMPRYIRIRQQPSKAALVDTAREVAGTRDTAALERSLREILTTQAKSFRFKFTQASATLGGLSTGTGKRDTTTKYETEEMVFAMHEVPAHATTVDPQTGALHWVEASAVRDPISEEAFDTPEYADSAAGHEQESEQLFDEVLNGTDDDTDGSSPHTSAPAR